MNPLSSPLPFSRFLIGAVCGALMAAPHGAQAAQPARFHLSGENKSLHEWATLDWPFVLDPPGPIAALDLKGINPGGPMIPAGGPVDPAPSASASNVSLAPDFILFRTGTVDLEANLRDNKTRGLIDVSVRGYSPGTYMVDAVTVSSTSTVTLGSLTVASGTNPILTGTLPITAYNSSVLVKRAVSTSPAIVVIWPWGGFGSAQFGGKDSPFPHGFDPFDIQSVSLSDSNGNLVSTATLTPVQNGYYSALSPLAPGKDVHAGGSALIRATKTPLFLPETALDGAVTLPMQAKVVSSDSPVLTLKRTSAHTTTADDGGAGLSGIWSGPVPISPVVVEPISTGSLSGVWGTPVPISPVVVKPLPIIFWNPSSGQIAIHAHGLPARVTLTYAADGTDLGTAMTNAHGELSVFARQGNGGSIPSTVDLFSVQILTIHTASGKVLARADF